MELDIRSTSEATATAVLAVSGSCGGGIAKCGGHAGCGDTVQAAQAGQPPAVRAEHAEQARRSPKARGEGSLWRGEGLPGQTRPICLLA